METQNEYYFSRVKFFFACEPQKPLQSRDNTKKTQFKKICPDDFNKSLRIISNIFIFNIGNVGLIYI